jgi:VWFA-related protein
MSARASILVLATMLCLAPVGAQQEHQDGAQPQTPRFGANATAILVDVVVRDRRGLPVTNLAREDFELYENGVRQDIADMTMVAPRTGPAVAPPSSNRGAASPSSPTASDRPAAARSAMTTPTFVALVFDRLSPDARPLAYKGALAYLDTIHEDDFAGVFLADLSLETLQTYTNDRDKLRVAIRKAATRATGFEMKSVGNLGQGDTSASVPVVASPESIGRPVDTRAKGDVASVEAGTRLSFEKLERDQKGYATTDALLALAVGLAQVPGRKSIIFFAEGVSIPDAVLPRFKNVVATANRGNVSVYTIDAAGLRVHSKDAETGRAVRGLGAAGLALGADGSNSISLATMEANEDVLRKDPRTSLTMLAEQTGGFLVDSTNDLPGAFRKIDQDRRFHYLLSYTPKNSEFNGEWRSLAIKVPGRPVTIRARSGYFAVHAPGLIPLLAYEAPALAALEQAPPPRAVSLRTTAFAFPEADTVRLALLVSTPASGLTFSRNETAQAYATDFTIVARIRNTGGDVIRKASQPYRLRGRLTDLETARNGDVLFFRHPTLGPGTYIIEAAVHDALATKSGVDTMTLTVPARTRSGLQVGSLVIVRRGERVSAAERDPENPLMMGDVVLYPNIGEPVRKGDKAITLFFVMSSKSKALPAATLEVVLGDKVLASLPVALDAPDAHGTIRQLAQLPTAALPAADYLLRLAIHVGGERQVREAQVRLSE